jgi:hypothetical protein
MASRIADFDAHHFNRKTKRQYMLSQEITRFDFALLKNYSF